MHQITWTTEDLRDCLLAMPPLELKGMALLRERRPADGFFPTDIPRTTMVEAITEITAYAERARRMGEALANLAPIPLFGQPVLEYGL
ncbi:MAG: hypothetical protein SF029_09160 [bacterium]|nr:hypothetical protein [bacterium]